MADDYQTKFGAQALDLATLQNRYQNVVISGCQVTSGTGRTQNVASGAAVVNGSRFDVSSGSVTLSLGDSDPRKDVVYIDGSGNIQAAEGTPQAAQPSGQARRNTYYPAPPDLSSTNACVLAEVWVAANASSTGSADISDRRQFAAAVFGQTTHDRVTFHDEAASPSSNGEMQRDGADIKAYTGGGVKNLSDIGTASGGVQNPLTANLDLNQFDLVNDTFDVLTISASDEVALFGDSGVKVADLATPTAMNVDLDLNGNQVHNPAGRVTQVTADVSDPSAEVIVVDNATATGDVTVQLNPSTTGLVRQVIKEHSSEPSSNHDVIIQNTTANMIHGNYDASSQLVLDASFPESLTLTADGSSNWWVTGYSGEVPAWHGTPPKQPTVNDTDLITKEGSTQSPTIDGSMQDVTFDTADLSQLGGTDTANNQIDIQTDGTYQLMGAIRVEQLDPGAALKGQLAVNGTANVTDQTNAYEDNSTLADNSLRFHRPRDLTSGDTITMDVSIADSASAVIAAVDPATWMAVTRLA